MPYHFIWDDTDWLLSFHIFNVVKFILGHESVTKLLIDNQADVNAIGERELTPLHLTVVDGKFLTNTLTFECMPCHHS